MKRIFLIFLVSVCFGIIKALLLTSPAHAFFFFKPKKCQVALRFCEAVNEGCGAECSQTFLGDGYPNPDSLEVSGQGPALNYTDNGDLTATDGNTKFMWEVKLGGGGSD